VKALVVEMNLTLRGGKLVRAVRLGDCYVRCGEVLCLTDKFKVKDLLAKGCQSERGFLKIL